MNCVALSLIVGVVLAPPSGAEQEGLLLRRALSAESIDTYTIVDKTVQTVKSPLGDMPVTVSSSRTLSLHTKSVDKAAGTAVVEATTTFDKLESDGAAAAMMKTKPGPMTQDGKMDVRGRITFEPKRQADGIGTILSGAESTVAAGSFVEFPEKAVKVGDSWEVVVPKSPMLFNADQKLTESLVGERQFNGVAVWVVSVRGTLQTSIDTAKLPGAKPIESALGPTSFRISGQDSIVGEGLVDKTTGRTLSMTTKAQSKKTIEIVEAGLTIDSTGTVETSLLLKEPKAP